MYKIIAPLKPGMRGEAVAKLQEALLSLYKKHLLKLSPELQKELEEYIDQEIHGSEYGRLTTELVRTLQLQYRLNGTGMVNEETAVLLNSILKELEEKFPPFKVQGTVRYTDESPTVGLTVQAYDKDLRNEEFLGEIVTDQFGHYEIPYSRNSFRRAEKKSADLIVRLTDKNDPEHILAESEILFNAPDTAEIDFTLESKLSEFERLINGVSPLLQGEDVSPIDLTEEDIDFLAHESGFQADILRIFVAAVRITVESSIHIDLPFYDITALFYALGRKGEQLKLPELLKRDFYELRNELKEAIEEKLIPAHLSEWLDAFFNELDRLVNENELEKPNTHIEIQQKNMRVIGKKLEISPKKIDILIDKAIGIDGIDDDLLISLVKEEKLNENEAKQFGLAINLYQLLDGDTSLVKLMLRKNLSAIRDLSAFRRADWQNIINEAEVTPPQNLSADDYASLLAKRIEKLYPGEALQSYFRMPNEGQLDEELSNPDRLINRYHGLKLAGLFEGGPAVEDIQERIGLLDSFYAQNQNVNLLALDYMPDSKDIEKLSPDFAKLEKEKKEMIFDHMKARQRVYGLTGDAEHTKILMEQGYHSALSITEGDLTGLLIKTDLDKKKAAEYYKAAENTMVAVANNTGAIFDLLQGGFPNIRVGNLQPDIGEYLKKLKGYEDMFGNQTYCNCKHCRSVLSPSAYFVDLMRVVEKQILEPSFSKNPKHPLHLKTRRPGLWNLELSCDNTDTLVPTLDIINEILEDYIFAPDRTKKITDRKVVENDTYELLSKSKKSFRQPFSLPLEKLQIYLRHFDLTRADIAHLLDVDEEKKAQAVLQISKEEYELISKKNDGYAFLQDIYGGIGFDFNSFDAHTLLKPMGLSRKELGQLIHTKFVAAGGQAVYIKAEHREEKKRRKEAEKKTKDKSIQNDVEHIYGLTYAHLDRMHRFTRLWKKLDWSIGELDLVLKHLQDRELSGLEKLSMILELQKKLNLSVEQVCVLWGNLPKETIDNKKWSLTDRLFNMPPFGQPVKRLPFPRMKFTHPVFLKESKRTNQNNVQQRLLAGLNIDDDALYKLIVQLGNHHAWEAEDIVSHPSKAKTDYSFSLTLENLSLLYRHALLARQLEVSITELFNLIKYAGIKSGHIKNLEAVAQLLKFHEFYKLWKKQGYSLDDIAFIVGDKVSEPENYPQSEKITKEILDNIQKSKSLEFADTIFAFIPGITEEMSRQIVNENCRDDTKVIEKVKKGTYRISKAFSPNNHLIIPKNVSEETKDQIKSEFMKYHASKIIPLQLAGKLNFSVDKTRALIGMIDIDLSDAAYTTALRLSKPDQTLVKLVKKLLPLSVLFHKDIYEQKAIDFIYGYRDIFAIKDFNRLSVENIQKLFIYEKFAGNDDETDSDSDKVNIEHLHTTLLALHNRAIKKVTKPESITMLIKPDSIAALMEHNTLANMQGEGIATHVFDPDAITNVLEPSVIAGVLHKQPSLIKSILQTLKDTKLLPNSAPEALSKIADCAKVAQYLGVGGETLPFILADKYDELSQASDALLGAFRAKYTDEKEWKEKSDPYEDLIRSRKRDALTDYLIHSIDPKIFRSESDLYQYFLIDVELTGCARTSRLVAAISSLQLYVHRVLMNLEQSEDQEIHVRPKDPANDPEKFRSEWTWRKNYRVWEANRKVFLFPETYIEPELRDNKTPLFEELESTLLQQEVNEQNVLDAYAAYVNGFEEVAKLKIAGSYHEKDEKCKEDILHLFGVTPSDPPIYYYRAVENAHYGEVSDDVGIVWNPWKKIDVQIPVRKVSPIVFQGRLYVFWVEIVTTPKNKVIDGNSIFVGYKHKLSVKYTMLRLDDTWTVPQEISLPDGVGVVDDLLGKYRKEIPNYFADNPLPKDSRKYASLLPKALNLEGEELREFLDEQNNYSINKLFIPKYGTHIHTEPQEGYTLKGLFWDQIYPDVKENKLLITISGKKYTGLFDIYKKSLNQTNESDVINRVLYIQEIVDEPRRLVQVYNTSIQTGGLYKGYTNVLYWHTLSPKYLTPNGESIPILKINNSDELSIVNPTFHNCLIDSDGDILYLQNNTIGRKYLLKRLGTTCSEEIGRLLFSEGVGALLSTNTQENKLGEANFPVAPIRKEFISIREEKVNKLDFTGSYGTYYREIFFHIPFLIANHLNSQQKFEAAQKWYQYIFDPTANDHQKPDHQEDVYWRYLEFRKHKLPKLREILTNNKAITAYEKDPFNPHAIARQRLSAYQKSIVMKYIDNLLDWGDKLFSRFTMESVNEATMLYIMAADILGDHPVELGDCGEGGLQHRDYENIKPLMKKGSDFLIELESLAKRDDPHPKKATDNWYSYLFPYLQMITAYPYETGSDKTSDCKPLMRTDWKKTHIRSWISPDDARSRIEYDSDKVEENSTPSAQPTVTMKDAGISSGREKWNIPKANIEMIRQAGPVFCFPPNKELLAYWDRVDDRLYKIRHCMDIKGVRRNLALFAPEIDPRLLVRAKAVGLSIEDVLDATSGDLPPYRFEYLIAKAKSYAGTVQGFGASLLSALEKKDAEELSLLRLAHEQNIQKLTTKIKEWDIKVETESIETLTRQQAEAEYTKNYYEGLINEGLSDWEEAQQGLQVSASILHGVEAGISLVAAASGLTPQAGSPFSLNFGGVQLSGSLARVAGATSAVAKAVDISSSLVGLEAGNKRREQSWKHQLDLANYSLKQIEKKLVAAEIRKDIAKKSLNIHKKGIEQAEDMYKLYGSKFSNLGLYTWLSRILHGLYRDAYNSAFSMARLAEQAYQFERGYDATVALGGNTWEAEKSGLLAGERLLMDLQHMEQRFIETNYRSMEIDQSFSLAQLDPRALIALREKGNCAFKIPEFFFDLTYPGQYRRKIKAVRLSIPCITGPYVNVGATLTLTGSQLRNEASLKTDALKEVPVRRSVSIATSKAQNDSGVFEFNFHDERYMPFEGAGAAESTWKLTLPDSFRQFDYDTISDVIMHISYTAEEDGKLRDQVEARNKNNEAELFEALEDNSIAQTFSMKNDFATQWHEFKHPAANAKNHVLKFTPGKERFPFFVQNKEIAIDTIDVLVKCNDVECPKKMTIKYKDKGNGSPTISISDAKTTPSFALEEEKFGKLAYVLSIDPGKMDITKEITIESEAANVENIFLVVNYKLGKTTN